MFLDEKVLANLLKETPGKRTDPAIYYLLSQRFTAYWLYLRPTSEGIEITDVLMFWDDVCFLIEAKTREKQSNASELWIKNKIADGIKQINERAENLKDGVVTKLRNKWRGEIQFNPDKIKYYYGIIVIQHYSAPYDPRNVASEEFNKSKIPIQVFSLFDFSELLRFINTPVDFLVYYEMRNKYGRENFLMVHNEFETYKSILFETDEGDVNSKQIDEEKEFLLSYSKAILRTNDALDEDYKNVAYGLLIDLAIVSLCKKSPSDETGKRVGNDDHDFFIESIESMVELSRRRRCLYGKLWYSVALKALKNGALEYNQGTSPSRQKLYLFLSSTSLTNEVMKSFTQEVPIEIMGKSNTKRCIIYGASTDKILLNYNYLYNLVIGNKDNPELSIDNMIDTISAYISIDN